jgi:hypothetical protein
MLPAMGKAADWVSPASARSSASRLKVYQPRVETNPIYFPHPAAKPLLQYNHDSDLVRYRGRYLAVWNANTHRGENTPGQFNYVSTSADARVWNAPTKPFTAESGAENAVEWDNQWQPAFVNFHDRLLFCAWCTFTGEKTFVSRSADGQRWTNVEVPTAPPSLLGRVVGFPTTHGLLSSRDAIMFPCSLPVRGRFTTDTTRYAAILFSTDEGKTWKWSEPIEAVSWSDLDEDPKRFGGELIALWEPTLWENPDGSFGLLVRNSTAQDPVTRPQRFEKPHRMIFTAHSADGRHWSKARPIEVDSLCARMLALGGATSPSDLQMVMNDWPTAWPERISSNRFFLALFCSPVAEPDLLLPGPVLQPFGGRAHYPNGFVEEGRLYVSYSYSPGIHSSIVHQLPDYAAPFLLPRGSRPGLILTDDHAILQQRNTSLGLVLTRTLTEQKELRLTFSYATKSYDGTAFPILTAGGKTHSGVELVARYEPKLGQEVLEAKIGEDTLLVAATKRAGEWNHLELVFGADGFRVRANTGEWFTHPKPLLRKLSFGGLYRAPDWPPGKNGASDVRVALDSIHLA